MTLNNKPVEKLNIKKEIFEIQRFFFKCGKVKFEI